MERKDESVSLRSEGDMGSQKPLAPVPSGRKWIVSGPVQQR